MGEVLRTRPPMREGPACGGPMCCPFPHPARFGTWSRWTCPYCGSLYLMTWPRRWRPWRRWAAPDGRWMLLRERGGAQ